MAATGASRVSHDEFEPPRVAEIWSTTAGVSSSSRSKAQEWSEASGLEQGSGDVVGEVAEAEGGAAEVHQRCLAGRNTRARRARFLKVRPSVMTSVKAAGTPLLTESMTAWSSPAAADGLGSR
jgi:hypothetical protein